MESSESWTQLCSDCRVVMELCSYACIVGIVGIVSIAITAIIDSIASTASLAGSEEHTSLDMNVISIEI